MSVTDYTGDRRDRLVLQITCNLRLATFIFTLSLSLFFLYYTSSLLKTAVFSCLNNMSTPSSSRYNFSATCSITACIISSRVSPVRATLSSFLTTLNSTRMESNDDDDDGYSKHESVLSQENKERPFICSNFSSAIKQTMSLAGSGSSSKLMSWMNEEAMSEFSTKWLQTSLC